MVYCSVFCDIILRYEGFKVLPQRLSLRVARAFTALLYRVQGLADGVLGFQGGLPENAKRVLLIRCAPLGAPWRHRSFVGS